SFLFGYRQLLEGDRAILGTYLGYDFRNTQSATFHQVSGGLEWLSETWEVRLNGYLPLGKRRYLVAENFTVLVNNFSQPRFQDHFLMVMQEQVTRRDRQFESALAGFDFEVGTSLLEGSEGDLRAYLGMYFYGGEGTESYGGVRSRLLARYHNNFNASLTLQSDGKYGTNLLFQIGMSWGGFRDRALMQSPRQSLLKKLAQPLIRQDRIVIDTQFESEIFATRSQVFLTNPITGQPWRFFHVTPGGSNGDGTVEFPFNNIVNAVNQTQGDRNEIVYVQTGTNPGLAGFTIPDFVQVLSTGPKQFINTVELGQLQLIGSGNNQFPLITDTVSMGNYTVLSGFTISGRSNAGVVVRNAGDVEVRDNVIRSNTTAGVLLENTRGLIDFRRNQVTSNNVPALVGDNLENVLIRDSHLSSFNSGSDGITLNGVRGNFNVENTRFNLRQSTGYGVRISQVTGSVKLTANSGSQIENAGLGGALLTSNTTLSGFTINAGGKDGVIANNVGNLQVRDNIITNGNEGIVIQNTVGAIALQDNQIANVTNGINLQNLNSPVTLTNNQIAATNNGINIQDNNNNIAIANNRLSNSINGINFQDIAGMIDITGNQVSQMRDRGINFGILDQTAMITIDSNQISQLGANGRGVSIDEMRNNAQTTINIVNNRITNIGDEGIYFNDIQDNARANITISGNTIANTNQEGIQFDFLEDNAIANIVISGNTIRDVGVNQEGIYFDDIQDDVQANITISGNTIERVGSRAIAFDLIQVNATPTITIENNTINTTGDQGIYFDDIEANVNAKITISGNAIANTGDDGIQFDTIENSATATLQILNNTLSNSAQDGIEIEHTSTSNLCLALSGNTATGITGNGFNFISAVGGGQFQIIDLANITTNNTGTFNPNNITINPNFNNGTTGIAPCP
ncbi:MAG: right-handed parallel beta-helix repeat-containing protein, partial [Jaaginema sp. PMC 1079.18]|nr:right-handed parallel beta-helix repeat-containing protein [Jaaginema sp. PMC 1079.18]